MNYKRTTLEDIIDSASKWGYNTFNKRAESWVRPAAGKAKSTKVVP